MIFFEGSLTGSAVYPREIMTLALEHKAAGLVFVHNHPSGDPAPSPEDQRLTRDLVWAAMLDGSPGAGSPDHREQSVFQLRGPGDYQGFCG